MLDHRVRDTAVEEPVIETDREYWEARSNSELLALMDSMLEMLHEIDPDIELNYNKQYVGLVGDHPSKTYVVFKPKRTQLNVEIKLPKGDYDSLLDETRIVQNQYSLKNRQYRLVIQPGISGGDKQLLQQMFKDAYEQSKGG